MLAVAASDALAEVGSGVMSIAKRSFRGMDEDTIVRFSYCHGLKMVLTQKK